MTMFRSTKKCLVELVKKLFLLMQRIKSNVNLHNQNYKLDIFFGFIYSNTSISYKVYEQ